jgi:hypothetical protein
VLETFRGQPAANSAELWKQVEDAVDANGKLLDEARNEPSSAVSLEGLSLLQQFGLEIEDALKALDLAVKGSKAEDGYAAQLEPELGKLVDDVERGFQFVAGCIHRWRFDQAPEGFKLEDDIAALQGRVAAIRPIGLAFPLDEILRAYAVQLHLKQLARLLRSSRIETGRAIG